MFDLEKVLKQWRAEMQARGVAHAETLDELEGHLREEYSGRITEGGDASTAFATAVAHLGTTGDLAIEFKKIRSWKNRYALGGLVFLACSAVLQAFFITRHFSGWILDAHIVSLSVGYEALLLAGALAGAWVLWPQLSLADSARIFMRVGAGLTLVALMLGSFLPGPSTDIATLEWQGAISVLIWLGVVLVLQMLRKTSERLDCLLALAVTLRVTWAWFGPFATARPMAGWVSILAIVLAGQVLLIGVGLIRRSKVVAG